MLWYFWRLSRGNLMLLVSLSIATSLAIRAGETGMPQSYYAHTNLTVQAFLIAIFGGCLFFWGRDSSFLPHPCLLTLPLATRRYLALFYGYAITVTGAVACGISALHLWLFGNHMQRVGEDLVVELWYLPVMGIALACLMQSMFHLAGIKNEFRVVPMALAMELLALFCVAPLLNLNSMNGGRIAKTAVLALLFAWGASLNSLAEHRNGRQRGGIAALLEWLDLGRGRTRVFRSTGTALFWMNWRRYGRVFPFWALFLTLIGIAVIEVCLMFYRGTPFSSKSEELVTVIYWTTLTMVCGAAFLCHILLLMRSHEDLIGAGRGYFLSLPVRSAALARGRLLAMLLSVLLVMAAGTAFIALLLRTPPHGQGIVSWDFFTSASLFVVAMWMLLWFGLFIAVGYAALVPIFLGIAILGVSTNALYYTIVLAVVTALATGLFLTRGIRKGLMNRSDLLLFSLACLFSMFMAVGMSRFALSDPRRWFYALYLSCLFLPLALPFVAAPVVMHWIRHR